VVEVTVSPMQVSHNTGHAVKTSSKKHISSSPLQLEWSSLPLQRTGPCPGTVVVVMVTVVMVVVVVNVVLDVESFVIVLHELHSTGQPCRNVVPSKAWLQKTARSLVHKAVSSSTPLQVDVQELHSTGHRAETVAPTTGMRHRDSSIAAHASGSAAPLQFGSIVVVTVVLVVVVEHGPHSKGHRS